MRRARALALALAVAGPAVLAVGVSACESGPRAEASGPCSRDTVASSGGSVILVAAAFQSVGVIVETGRDPKPHCVALDGSTVELQLGDWFQVGANYTPQVDPGPAGVVKIRTTRAPEGHVLATVTGTAPGIVGVSWIECSGPEC